MTTVLTRRSLAAFGLAAATSFFVHVEPAAAQSGPRAEVLVIHGTKCDKPSVDPAIGQVPPLKYDCYKLLQRQILPLSKTTPSTMTLPNGRTFKIEYGGVSGDKEPRHKISASISEGGGFKQVAEVSAEPQKRFYVGGFNHQGGALLLAITILQ